MTKIFDATNVLTLANAIGIPDKESVKAQKQWQKDGTVSIDYLNHTLGDISVSISAFLPLTNSQQDETVKSKPRN
jgi:hypothetical protein